jgi:hypothetical protein
MIWLIPEKLMKRVSHAQFLSIFSYGSGVVKLRELAKPPGIRGEGEYLSFYICNFTFMICRTISSMINVKSNM